MLSPPIRPLSMSNLKKAKTESFLERPKSLMFSELVEVREISPCPSSPGSPSSPLAMAPVMGFPVDDDCLHWLQQLDQDTIDTLSVDSPTSEDRNRPHVTLRTCLEVEIQPFIGQFLHLQFVFLRAIRVCVYRPTSSTRCSIHIHKSGFWALKLTRTYANTYDGGPTVKTDVGMFFQYLSGHSRTSDSWPGSGSICRGCCA